MATELGVTVCRDIKEIEGEAEPAGLRLKEVVCYLSSMCFCWCRCFPCQVMLCVVLALGFVIFRIAPTGSCCHYFCSMHEYSWACDAS